MEGLDLAGTDPFYSLPGYTAVGLALSQSQPAQSNAVQLSAAHRNVKKKDSVTQHSAH